MYITIIIAVLVIAGLLGYHIKLAYSFRVDLEGEQSILGWYLVGASVISVALLVSAFLVAKVQNGEIQLMRKAKGAPKSQQQPVDMDRTNSTSDLVVEDEDRWPQVEYHPHHWAIFYTLAFLTRFDDPISNVCAGMVIGIYMHGIAAYGYAPII
jgi:hypothetical protein